MMCSLNDLVKDCSGLATDRLKCVLRCDLDRIMLEFKIKFSLTREGKKRTSEYELYSKLIVKFD